MTMVVRVPKKIPVAPLWFENIQLVSKWIPAPGPQLPRGNSP